MAAPLTERELLTANLARREALGKVFTLVSAGFPPLETLATALARNQHPGDLQHLLDEHERTTRGMVEDADS